MIVNKKQFTIGLVMAISFAIVFAIVMSPVMGGKTVIQVADNLFNSLTKGSTDYIQSCQKDAAKFEGVTFDGTVSLKSQEEVDRFTKIYTAAGVKVEATDTKVKFSGDLGKMTKAALADADAVFKNDDARVNAKYGLSGKEALYYWWNGINTLNTKYKVEGKASEMSFVNKVETKALEPAYNFEGIQAVKVADSAGITTFMLVFYIIYTVWYGFAIMYIFEGLGIIASSHGEKAEA